METQTFFFFNVYFTLLSNSRIAVKQYIWLLPNTDGMVSKSDIFFSFPLKDLVIANSDIQDDKLRNTATATSFCRLEDLRQASQSIKRLLLTERETSPALCSVLAYSFSLEVFQDGEFARMWAL